MVTQETAAHAAQRIVVALATAARAAGVTHLRLRCGPVREMVLLPADPPATEESKDSPEETAEEARRERDARLYGEPS